jgi:ABC-type glutathione transport system ATPase component
LRLEIENLSHSGTPMLFHKFCMIDELKEFNLIIEPGKVYGLIGSIGLGGWLLSYLLAGRDHHFQNSSDSPITLNGEPVHSEALKKLSCYVGEGVAEIPYRYYRRYPWILTWKIRGIKTVAEQISEGIQRTSNRYSLQEIVDMFELTGLHEKGRIHRPLEFNSGERWRASLAIGFAFQKKLFCVPWIEPYGIKYLLSNYNSKYLKNS